MATASSQYLPGVHTKHQKAPQFGAPNRTQVGVCSNNLDVPHNTSLTCIPQIMGTPPRIQVEIHLVLDRTGIKTIKPTIPQNRSQALLGRKKSTHGTISETQ